MEVDAGTNAARGGQQESTDDSDLRQGGRVEDVPDDGITKRQSCVMRRTLNRVKSTKSDVYMTCEGRVLRQSDELRSSGVDDGCTVQIMNMMRGGGNHRNKKNRA